MKKLLSILGVVSLTTTGISGIVANKTYQINALNYGWIKTLRVTPIRQETDYYCAATSVQMILNYFNNNIYEYSQEYLHGLIGGVPGQGAHIDRTISFVIENHIDNHDERDIEYYYNELGAGYGTNDSELRLFQQYVVASLNNNCPLFFGYVPSQNDGHAVVINGIEINDDPLKTVYHYIDPWNGQQLNFVGSRISYYCTLGGELVGGADNFDFKNKKIKITTEASVSRYDRMESGDVQTTDYFLNLNQVGISDRELLNQASNIEFPDLTLSENWNGKEENYSGDSWSAKKIKGNQSWTEWNSWEYYHEYFLAKAKLWWYDSTKIMDDWNCLMKWPPFFIDFQYKYKCTTIASDSTIDVRLNFGNVIFITY